MKLKNIFEVLFLKHKNANCFPSNNKNKIFEIQSMLPDTSKFSVWRILVAMKIFPKPQILLKECYFEANYVTTKYGYDCFADDTGLEVAVLNGEPGFTQLGMQENAALMTI
jgi:inosine/xanthosine triphosphate pyrophosphatase family protein